MNGEMKASNSMFSRGADGTKREKHTRATFPLVAGSAAANGDAVQATAAVFAIRKANARRVGELSSSRPEDGASGKRADAADIRLHAIASTGKATEDSLESGVAAAEALGVLDQTKKQGEEQQQMDKFSTFNTLLYTQVKHEQKHANESREKEVKRRRAFAKDLKMNCFSMLKPAPFFRSSSFFKAIAIDPESASDADFEKELERISAVPATLMRPFNETDSPRSSRAGSVSFVQLTSTDAEENSETLVCALHGMHLVLQEALLRQHENVRVMKMYCNGADRAKSGEKTLKRYEEGIERMTSRCNDVAILLKKVEVTLMSNGKQSAMLDRIAREVERLSREKIETVQAKLSGTPENGSPTTDDGERSYAEVSRQSREASKGMGSEFRSSGVGSFATGQSCDRAPEESVRIVENFCACLQAMLHLAIHPPPQLQQQQGIQIEEAQPQDHVLPLLQHALHLVQTAVKAHRLTSDLSSFFRWVITRVASTSDVHRLVKAAAQTPDLVLITRVIVLAFDGGSKTYELDRGITRRTTRKVPAFFGGARPIPDITHVLATAIKEGRLDDFATIAASPLVEFNPFTNDAMSMAVVFFAALCVGFVPILEKLLDCGVFHPHALEVLLFLNPNVRSMSIESRRGVRAAAAMWRNSQHLALFEVSRSTDANGLVGSHLALRSPIVESWNSSSEKEDDIIRRLLQFSTAGSGALKKDLHSKTTDPTSSTREHQVADTSSDFTDMSVRMPSFSNVAASGWLDRFSAPARGYGMHRCIVVPSFDRGVWVRRDRTTFGVFPSDVDRSGSSHSALLRGDTPIVFGNSTTSSFPSATTEAAYFEVQVTAVQYGAAGKLWREEEGHEEEEREICRVGWCTGESFPQELEQYRIGSDSNSFGISLRLHSEDEHTSATADESEARKLEVTARGGRQRVTIYAHGHRTANLPSTQRSKEHEECVVPSPSVATLYVPTLDLYGAGEKEGRRGAAMSCSLSAYADQKPFFLVVGCFLDVVRRHAWFTVNGIDTGISLMCPTEHLNVNAPLDFVPLFPAASVCTAAAWHCVDGERIGGGTGIPAVRFAFDAEDIIGHLLHSVPHYLDTVTIPATAKCADSVNQSDKRTFKNLDGADAAPKKWVLHFHDEIEKETGHDGALPPEERLPVFLFDNTHKTNYMFHILRRRLVSDSADCVPKGTRGAPLINRQEHSLLRTTVAQDFVILPQPPLLNEGIENKSYYTQSVDQWEQRNGAGGGTGADASRNNTSSRVWDEDEHELRSCPIRVSLSPCSPLYAALLARQLRIALYIAKSGVTTLNDALQEVNGRRSYWKVKVSNEKAADSSVWEDGPDEENLHEFMSLSSPLLLAAALGYVDVVKALLKKANTAEDWMRIMNVPLSSKLALNNSDRRKRDTTGGEDGDDYDALGVDDGTRSRTTRYNVLHVALIAKQEAVVGAVLHAMEATMFGTSMEKVKEGAGGAPNFHSKSDVARFLGWPTPRGRSPMLLATRLCLTEAVEHLIRLGAPPLWCESVSGSNGVEVACACGAKSVALALLDSEVYTPKILDRPGTASALCWCAHKADLLPVLTKLLDVGASPFVAMEGGLTPLHLSLAAKNRDGAIAIVRHIARKERLEQESAEGGAMTTTKRKMDGNQSVLARDDYTGCTPLHLASECGDASAVYELLRLPSTCSADLCYPNVDEMTPLHLAIVNGHEDCAIHLLMSAKAFAARQQGDGATFDVNASDRRGDTALHCAVRQPHGTMTRVIEFILLEFSAERRSTLRPAEALRKNASGETVLNSAVASCEPHHAIALLSLLSEEVQIKLIEASDADVLLSKCVEHRYYSLALELLHHATSTKYLVGDILRLNADDQRSMVGAASGYSGSAAEGNTRKKGADSPSRFGTHYLRRIHLHAYNIFNLALADMPAELLDQRLGFPWRREGLKEEELSPLSSPLPSIGLSSNANAEFDSTYDPPSIMKGSNVSDLIEVTRARLLYTSHGEWINVRTVVELLLTGYDVNELNTFFLVILHVLSLTDKGSGTNSSDGGALPSHRINRLADFNTRLLSSGRDGAYAFYFCDELATFLKVHSGILLDPLDVWQVATMYRQEWVAQGSLLSNHDINDLLAAWNKYSDPTLSGVELDQRVKAVVTVGKDESCADAETTRKRSVVDAMVQSVHIRRSSALFTQDQDDAGANISEALSIGDAMNAIAIGVLSAIRVNEPTAMGSAKVIATIQRASTMYEELLRAMSSRKGVQSMNSSRATSPSVASAASPPIPQSLFVSPFGFTALQLSAALGMSDVCAYLVREGLQDVNAYAHRVSSKEEVSNAEEHSGRKTRLLHPSYAHLHFAFPASTQWPVALRIAIRNRDLRTMRALLFPFGEGDAELQATASFVDTELVECEGAWQPGTTLLQDAVQSGDAKIVSLVLHAMLTQSPRVSEDHTADVARRRVRQQQIHDAWQLALRDAGRDDIVEAFFATHASTFHAATPSGCCALLTPPPPSESDTNSTTSSAAAAAAAAASTLFLFAVTHTLLLPRFLRMCASHRPAEAFVNTATGDTLVTHVLDEILHYPTGKPGREKLLRAAAWLIRTYGTCSPSPTSPLKSGSGEEQIDLSSVRKDGETALRLAARIGEVPLISLLLECGCRVDDVSRPEFVTGNQNEETWRLLATHVMYVDSSDAGVVMMIIQQLDQSVGRDFLRCVLKSCHPCVALPIAFDHTEDICAVLDSASVTHTVWMSLMFAIAFQDSESVNLEVSTGRSTSGQHQRFLPFGDRPNGGITRLPSSCSVSADPFQNEDSRLSRSWTVTPLNSSTTERPLVSGVFPNATTSSFAGGSFDRLYFSTVHRNSGQTFRNSDILKVKPLRKLLNRMLSKTSPALLYAVLSLASLHETESSSTEYAKNPLPLRSVRGATDERRVSGALFGSPSKKTHDPDSFQEKRATLLNAMLRVVVEHLQSRSNTTRPSHMPPISAKSRASLRSTTNTRNDGSRSGAAAVAQSSSRSTSISTQDRNAKHRASIGRGSNGMDNAMMTTMSGTASSSPSARVRSPERVNPRSLTAANAQCSRAALDGVLEVALQVDDVETVQVLFRMICETQSPTQNDAPEGKKRAAQQAAPIDSTFPALSARRKETLMGVIVTSCSVRCIATYGDFLSPTAADVLASNSGGRYTANMSFGRRITDTDLESLQSGFLSPIIRHCLRIIYAYMSNQPSISLSSLHGTFVPPIEMQHSLRILTDLLSQSKGALPVLHSYLKRLYAYYPWHVEKENVVRPAMPVMQVPPRLSDAVASAAGISAKDQRTAEKSVDGEATGRVPEELEQVASIASFAKHFIQLSVAHQSQQPSPRLLATLAYVVEQRAPLCSEALNVFIAGSLCHDAWMLPSTQELADRAAEGTNSTVSSGVEKLMSMLGVHKTRQAKDGVLSALDEGLLQTHHQSRPVDPWSVGSPVNAQYRSRTHGDTLLHIMVMHNEVGLVRYFLEAVMECNAVLLSQATASSKKAGGNMLRRHEAMFEGVNDADFKSDMQEATAQLLCRKNKHGMLPFDYAETPEMVGVLSLYGCARQEVKDGGTAVWQGTRKLVRYIKKVVKLAVRSQVRYTEERVRDAPTAEESDAEGDVLSPPSQSLVLPLPNLDRVKQGDQETVTESVHQEGGQSSTASKENRAKSAHPKRTTSGGLPSKDKDVGKIVQGAIEAEPIVVPTVRLTIASEEFMQLLDGDNSNIEERLLARIHRKQSSSKLADTRGQRCARASTITEQNTRLFSASAPGAPSQRATEKSVAFSASQDYFAGASGTNRSRLPLVLPSLTERSLFHQGVWTPDTKTALMAQSTPGAHARGSKASPRTSPPRRSSAAPEKHDDVRYMIYRLTARDIEILRAAIERVSAAKERSGLRYGATAADSTRKSGKHPADAEKVKRAVKAASNANPAAAEEGPKRRKPLPVLPLLDSLASEGFAYSIFVKVNSDEHHMAAGDLSAGVPSSLIEIFAVEIVYGEVGQPIRGVAVTVMLPKIRIAELMHVVPPSLHVAIPPEVPRDEPRHQAKKKRAGKGKADGAAATDRTSPQICAELLEKALVPRLGSAPNSFVRAGTADANRNPSPKSQEPQLTAEKELAMLKKQFTKSTSWKLAQILGLHIAVSYEPMTHRDSKTDN